MWIKFDKDGQPISALTDVRSIALTQDEMRRGVHVERVPTWEATWAAADVIDAVITAGRATHTIPWYEEPWDGNLQHAWNHLASLIAGETESGEDHLANALTRLAMCAGLKRRQSTT